MSTSAAEIGNGYNLSPIQRWIWDHGQGDRNLYVQCSFRVSQPIRVQRASQIFNGIASDHEILSIRFVRVPGLEYPLQFKQEAPILEIVTMDVQPQGIHEQQALLRQLKISAAAKVTPSITITSLGSRVQDVIITLPAMYGDASSAVNLAHEFFGRSQDEFNMPGEIQYIQFSDWQNQLLSAPDPDAKLFWEGKSSGALKNIALPFEQYRINDLPLEAGFVVKKCSRKLLDKLKSVSKRSNVDMPILLLAAVKLFLQKHGVGNSRIDISFVVTKREFNELEGLVGPVAKTIPVGVTIESSDTLGNVLAKLTAAIEDAISYQSYFSWDYFSKNDLSDQPLVFEYLDICQYDLADSEREALEIDSFAEPFDKKVSFQQFQDKLLIKVYYGHATLNEISASVIAQQIVAWLENIPEDEDVKVSDISLIGPSERNQLLNVFRQTSPLNRATTTVVSSFLRQVEMRPEARAILFKDRTWNYRETEEMSNRMANLLTSKFDIGEGDFVALMLERSDRFVMTWLAVLKTGAIVVPVEPGLPKKRIGHILLDATAKLVVVDKPMLAADFPEIEVTVLDLDHHWDSLYTHAAIFSPTVSKEQPAYLLYTSGSTGTPKGCFIKHESLQNYLAWASREYLSDLSVANCPLFTSISFDFTLTSIFLPLTTGGFIKIVDQTAELLESMTSSFGIGSEINLIKLTPAHISLLDTLKVTETGVKGIIVGGEELTSRHVGILRGINPDFAIYNEYGPTEATIGCITWKVNESKNILIGRPIANTSTYILRENYELAAIGEPGEIYIGGIGLATSYKNRSGETAQKFLRLSHLPDEVVYKTGDCAKWMPDGNVMYLGRKDNQVKVNGFRIELEEIERCLVQVDAIQEVAVRVMDGADKKIVAYVRIRKPADAQSIRVALAKFLPEYMIPAHIVIMDVFPLTTNGKIDREALPDPATLNQKTFVPTVGSAEDLLAKIWREIFSKAQIGAIDNFLDLGGDSIKAILTSAKVFKAGFKLEVRKVFEFPVLRDLATKIVSKVNAYLPNVVEGPTPLTPIQKSFFESNFSEPHHYNQAISLLFSSRIAEEKVVAIFAKLVEHHDVLRNVFIRRGPDIEQVSSPEKKYFELSSFDFRQLSDDNDRLVAHANELQASFNLEHGPLVKLALFNLRDHDQLLIVIHHLLVDGVSWRILIEDIHALLLQTEESEVELHLPPKSTSYQEWSERVEEYARAESFNGEALFWTHESLKNIPALKIDFDTRSADTPQMRQESMSLDLESTQNLLTKVNQATRLRINEILLAALGLSFHEVFGVDALAVMLEGHGREELFDNVDLTRTVGWFTCEYPIILDVQNTDSLLTHIRKTKEKLRHYPQNGIGYGIWKHIGPGSENRGVAAAPSVSFNYLGQLDSDISQKKFRVSSGYTGEIIGRNNKGKFAFEVVGAVSEGMLHFSIIYDSSRYAERTAKKLARLYKQYLSQIVLLTIDTEPDYFLTPGDLTYKDFSMGELDRLSKYFSISDVYSLSPLQEGLFFQWKLYDDSSAYFNQIPYKIAGPLNIPAFEQAIDYVVGRHDMLRTLFIEGPHGNPLQLVLRHHQVKVGMEDLTAVSEAVAMEHIRTKMQEERRKGFDLLAEVPMRLCLYRLSNNQYHMVWSIHHIIIDAWCSNILATEFLFAYTKIIDKEQPSLPAATPFKAYVKWLAGQDKVEALRFWRSYLGGYCVNKLFAAGTFGTAFQKKEMVITLDETLTDGLRRRAQDANVTLNTLFNAVWGIVLFKYSGIPDIVFGSIVSGRPPEIDGIEGMVGVTINMIPVRITWEQDDSFEAFLRNTHSQLLSCTGQGFVSLAMIQSETLTGPSLIDHYIDFHNISGDVYVVDSSKLPASPVAIEHLRGDEQSNYNLQVLVSSGPALEIVLRYNGLIIEDSMISDINMNLRRALERITRPGDFAIAELMSKSEERSLADTHFTQSLIRQQQDDF